MKFAIYKTSRLALRKAGAAVSKNGGICDGFTLIELLVYMAIMGFIIVVAGRVFSDSTSMRVRSQNMIASAEEGGRVTALLKEDISQMGTKSFVEKKNSTDFFDSVASVHMKFPNEEDLSSYILTKGEGEGEEKNYDKLVFRKLNYGTNGICNALLEVTWFVENKALKRKCEVIPSKCDQEIAEPAENEEEPAENEEYKNFKASICPDTVEMVSGITKFKFLPSKPGRDASYSSDSKMFPPPGVLGFFDIRLPNTAGPMPAKVIKSFSNTPTPSHFVLVSNIAGNCHSFDFSEGEEYAIEFKLLHGVNSNDPCIIIITNDDNNCSENERYNPMNMFQAGYDHLSLGLRDPSDGTPLPNTPVSDFLFYPPQDDNADSIRRHFRFSVPTSLNACIGITADFKSNAKNGHLDFEDFKVFRITDKVYHFDREEPDYNPTATSTPNKASVKAFRLTLSIQRKREINETVMVIPVPNNGIAGGF